MSTPDVSIDKEEMLNLNAASLTEILFVLIPFLIILLTNLYKEGASSLPKIIYIPEWSFTALILSGQTLVKFVSVLISKKTELNQGVIALAITLLFTMLVIPSLVVLIFILLSVETPHVSLAISQIILFILATLAFLLPERIGYVITLNKNKHANKNPQATTTT